MKKHILPFIGILFLLAACGPTKEDAVVFNDCIVGMQKICLNAEDSFYDVCDNSNPESIKNSLENFKASVMAADEKLDDFETHAEFDAYRQSGVNLIKTYKAMLNAEFSDYARLCSIPEGEYAEKDEAEQKELVNKINTSLDLLNKNFIEEQERFAGRWGITLEKETNCE